MGKRRHGFAFRNLSMGAFACARPPAPSRVVDFAAPFWSHFSHTTDFAGRPQAQRESREGTKGQCGFATRLKRMARWHLMTDVDVLTSIFVFPLIGGLACFTCFGFIRFMRENCRPERRQVHNIEIAPAAPPPDHITLTIAVEQPDGTLALARSLSVTKSA
jgi:hypothetical protein